MGEQLYTVVYKRHETVGYTANGKPKIKSTRGFRAPHPEDDVEEQVRAAFEAKRGEWEARNVVPNEEVPRGYETTIRWPLDRYGVRLWTDQFSPRQLLGHSISVEVFQEIVHELAEKEGGRVPELDKAALTYLTIAMDKLLNYNSRMSVWMPTREVVANTFNRHDFAVCLSHSEMAPTIVGLGYDWAIEQTGKSLKELTAR